MCMCICEHKGCLEKQKLGPPLGVNGGDVESDSLEPEHHE